MLRAFFLSLTDALLVLTDDQALTFSDLLREDCGRRVREAKKKQDVIDMFN